MINQAVYLGEQDALRLDVVFGLDKYTPNCDPFAVLELSGYGDKEKADVVKYNEFFSPVPVKCQPLLSALPRTGLIKTNSCVSQSFYRNESRLLKGQGWRI